LTFHYPKDFEEIRAALSNLQTSRSEIFLGSGTNLETRYGIADDIRAQRATKLLGTSVEELTDVMETMAGLVSAWLAFAHGAISMHLKTAGLERFERISL
jgi:hypothetical protein